ncbi:molecular chaperone TorD family protein [Persephonella atlantica]|uniref:Molecular chaperone TorD family protein n=1 Tax=Persephonella atlantica TaxID=2699429 RepID=A0ABS1GI32_9AQUI|nr:molecular chaperone TorD family protein [Persephonella atlantica]MBK3332596.1 molecular chaperone TorD family protein [Persephonella atlantica]
MEEKMQEVQARINMYGLLSRLFIEEIDVDTLKKIKENPDMLDLFPKTKQWKQFFEKEPQKLIEEELNVDFTTVFLLNVYPYESVFMNDEGYIDPSITNPALIFYREHGYSIDLNKTRALSPDHIAVEMEFMMTLAKEELEALKQDDTQKVKNLKEIQKKFLEEHLANWGVVYLLSAKDMAETPFYQDVCELALEFILSDYELLSEDLEGVYA